MKIRIKMSAKNGQFEERKSKESTVQPVSLSLSPEDEEKPELFFFSLPSSFFSFNPLPAPAFDRQVQSRTECPGWTVGPRGSSSQVSSVEVEQFGGRGGEGEKRKKKKKKKCVWIRSYSMLNIAGAGRGSWEAIIINQANYRTRGEERNVSGRKKREKG